MPYWALPEMTLPAPAAVPPIVVLLLDITSIPSWFEPGFGAGQRGRARRVRADRVALDERARHLVEQDAAGRVARDDVAGAAGRAADRAVRRLHQDALGVARRRRPVGRADVAAQDRVAPVTH